jgi:minor extracellular serine protease Vpr
MEGSRKRPRALAVAASGVALAVAAVIAIPSALAGGGTASSAEGLYFVELASPPTEDGTPLATTQREKREFRAEVQGSGLDIEERISFNTLFNGMSVEATEKESLALEKLGTVAAVWPVLTVSIPQTRQANPDLATAIKMTGADVAQNTLGLSGDGVHVAVMDTGVDYDHASLGGTNTDNDPNSDDATLNGFPNSRVIKGWDFVGNAFNADEASPDYNPVAVADPDPDDCNGHGTHVAGIIGANGAVTGVAPDVKLGSYRVFGCDGSTTSDIMLQAMERARKDKMDILNMSIGSRFQTWAQYPTAAAADRLVDKGVIVVASIGNSGASGVYSAGAPGVGRDVIGVASIDNSHVQARGFTISPDNQPMAYSDSVSSSQTIPDPPDPPTSGTFEIKETAEAAAVGPVPPNTYPGGTTFPDGCSAFPAGFFAGKVALIRRGTCAFTLKAQNAEAAGAVAVVLYNHTPGGLTPIVAGTPNQVGIPVVMVTKENGELIHNRLASGPVSLTWHALVTVQNPTGGLISRFSSYGLTAELDVKPDVAAPGGFIRSTWPLEAGGFNTISGTSMSSPHVAGAVALILEAHAQARDEDDEDDDDDGHGGLDAEDVRTLLQNSANPVDWFGAPGIGFLESVHSQGAGMIDIVESVQATTTIEPSKLALGESSGPKTRRITLRNSSSSPVTYTLGNEGAVGTSGTFPTLGFWLNFATASFSRHGSPVTEVTVPARRKVRLDVTFTDSTDPDEAEPNSVYGGFLTFTGGGHTYRVPYAGFLGDYQSLKILEPAGVSAANPQGIFPTIGRLVGPLSATDLTPVHTPVAAGHVFNMQSGNVPYVLAHFAHQVRTVRIDLYSATTNQLVGEAVADEFRERNSRRTGTTNDTDSDVYMPFALDGTVKKNKNKRTTVADGSYFVKLSLLKALGDSRNPAHWETWTSQPFTIDRP